MKRFFICLLWGLQLLSPSLALGNIVEFSPGAGIHVPIITCPADILVSNSPGLCEAIVSFPLPAHTGGPGSVLTQLSGFPSGSTFPVGVTTNIFLVTDILGATASCSFNITVTDNEPPVAICQNVSLNLGPSGSQTLLAAQVDNGSVDNCGLASISVSPDIFSCADAGTHSVTLTVTDVNGNSSTCLSTVTVNTDPLVLTLSTPVFNCGYNISCFAALDGSASATVTGGCAPYMYVWSNAQTTQTTSGLGAGNYSVLVTDANGNSASGFISLTEPDQLTAVIVADTFQCGYNISCHDSCNGSATVFPSGGCAPYSYTWSNAATTQQVTGLCAGMYSVTVTDNNGCTETVSVTMTQPPPLVVTVTPMLTACGTAIGCHGDSTCVELTITGGSDCEESYYTMNRYVPDGNGNWVCIISQQIRISSTPFDTIICWFTEGDYKLSITDPNGCLIYSNQFSITAPPPVSASGVTGSTPCAPPPPAPGTPFLPPPSPGCCYDISCFGGNDGFIDMSVSGGCPPYSYVWSNAATTQDLTGLIAGNYSVTVTDQNGCDTTLSFTLTQPPLLVSSGSSPVYTCGYNISCNAATDGSIDLNVSGGCSPYTFLWNNGATTEDLSGVGAGIYSVILTDVNGCTEANSFTLTQPDPLIAAPCNDQTVALGYAPMEYAILTTTATGGCPPYTFVWDNGAGAGQSVIVHPAFTTTYTLTVSDANGCTATAQTIVTVMDLRCGSKLDKVIMCDLHGHLKCVKQNEVYLKLQQGWSLGPCGEGLDFDGGDCGDPPYQSCKCTDCVRQVCFTYNGPPSATILFTRDPGGNHVLQIFTNVNSGQILCVNGSGSHPCLGPKTYARVNGGPGLKFETDCKKIQLGMLLGAITLTSYTDAAGAVCNAEAPPICPCSGKITALRLQYMGPNGASLKIYKNNNHTNMIYSSVGLNTFALINLTNPGGLPGTIYIELVGSGQPDVVVTLNCNSLYVADRYFYYDLKAYKSAGGGSCPAAVLKNNDLDAELQTENFLSVTPNPFKESAIINFSFQKDQMVRLDLVNIHAEELGVLLEGECKAGEIKTYSLDSGILPAGVYFLRLTTRSGILITKKMLLIK